MGCGAVVFISFLFFIEAQGLQRVFVQRGKDLYLELQEDVVLDKKKDLFWKFNTKNNIGKCSLNREPVLFGSYEGRAEFRPNYMLLVKNVQHSDSGVYTAIVTAGTEKTVAENKVTVLDPVSPVTLTVTPSSSDSCNITVTCSTVDISSIFRCDDQNCSQVEEKHLKDAKISSRLAVYLQQDTIFCNHSNQVSWEQSNKVTKLPCPTPVFNKATIAVISIGVLILAVLIVLGIFKTCKRKKNTIWEVPQDSLPDQN